MIQLRVRTEFSFGQTFAPIGRVVEHLKAIGCAVAGAVDHCSTWSHVKWHAACLKAGIQPLLGVELPVGQEMRNMWFLARNETGLRELYQFSSAAFRNKQATKAGHKPMLKEDQLLAISANVVVFAGEMLDEDLLKASNAVIDLSPASRVLNHSKRQIAERSGLRVVNVSDNAYSAEKDKQIFELISDRGVKPTPQFILPDLVDSDDAVAIALSCKDLRLPSAPMIRAKGDLEALCREGIAFRKLDWNDTYEARLQHELHQIKEKDFESYFIVVADMVRYAKQHMLVGPSRGSAAGSLVCYLARITEIDPIPPKLFFERFIDVSRSDLPDIDLDFPDTKREMVFQYMRDKYKFVSHIGTVSTFKPKSALIQVCKRLNIPPTATWGVKAAIIERSSADSRANNCLLDTLRETAPGKQLLQFYPQVIMAAELEAHASHTGVHAAGLLVCNEPIEQFATIDDNGIAQVEKEAAEKLGLLKIDVLGLRTLGVLEDSGVPVDWYNLKFDDPETYKVFNDCRLCSIFQFEGNALRSISAQIKFSSLTDIDAVTALARPGPFGGGVTQEYLLRREGKPYKAVHPLVEEHMLETYGLPVYQEQTLAIVRNIGQFDWKDTSTIRKAMSKRMGKEFFENFWVRFREGAMRQGISESEARQTWEMINAMGAWQMNKAHTYSYAVLSYWTAWLKAHHPLEFAAANLRNARDEETSVALLREMVREGIQYVAFDPLLSEETWSIKDGKLVAGYSALKGFGESKSKKYIEARNAGRLTQNMIDAALKTENVFADIFPMQTKYGHIYADPKTAGVLGEVLRMEQFDGTQGGSWVFLGKLIKKNPKNINEDIVVKKRGGKILGGPQEFLDVTVQDDTGHMLCRIDRFKYLRMGKPLFEEVSIGTDIMVRAHFRKGIRMAFVDKWKLLP